MEIPGDDAGLSAIKEHIRKDGGKTFTLKGLRTNVKALRSDETTLSNIDKLFETYEKVK